MTLQIKVRFKDDGSPDEKGMLDECSKRIAALTFAFKGEQPKAVLSKEDAAAVALGSKFFPKGKPRGRKADPNSARQKVFAAMRKVLSTSKEPMHKDTVLERIVKITGLSLAVCIQNANGDPQVMRNYGFWSLRPAGI